jgi:hypothetical protein
LFGPSFSLAPHHLPLPYTLSLPGRTCSILFFNFVEDISNNKKDIVFLVV